MLVTFYRISKKPNSTKSIDENSQDWVTVNVDIKEPCSLSAPVFTLHIMEGGDRSGPFCWPVNIEEEGHPDPTNEIFNLRRYTHVYMQTLNWECPIYRITDIELENTVATFYLEPDLLASYRDDILASLQYVGRCNNISKSNRTIADSLAVTVNQYRYSYASTGGNIFTSGYDNGNYVLGVVSTAYSSGITGGIEYYLFKTERQLKEFFNYMHDDSLYDGIDDISLELSKQLINPLQYIVSLKHFPLSLDYLMENGEPKYEKISIGTWTLPVYAYKLRDYETSIFGVIPKPTHPQSRADNDFLNINPYTQYTFYLEPFGAIPIDPAALASLGERLAFKVTVDHISGKGKLYLYRESSTTDYIGIYYADVGRNVQLNQVTENLTGVIKSGAATISDGIKSAFKMDLGGVISGVTSGSINTVELSMPQVHSSIGSTFVPFVGGPAVLYAKHTYIDTSYNNEFGYIVNSQRYINEYLGDWVQIPKPRLSIIATEANIEKIYELLQKGVFIE